MNVPLCPYSAYTYVSGYACAHVFLAILWTRAYECTNTKWEKMTRSSKLLECAKQKVRKVAKYQLNGEKCSSTARQNHFGNSKKSDLSSGSVILILIVQ